MSTEPEPTLAEKIDKIKPEILKSFNHPKLEEALKDSYLFVTHQKLGEPEVNEILDDLPRAFWWLWEEEIDDIEINEEGSN